MGSVSGAPHGRTTCDGGHYIRDVADSGRVGVVVVTFESPPELVRRCVDSVAASRDGDGPLACEVLVIDNASAVAPEVSEPARLLRRSSNDGFAAAVNTGVAALGSSCSSVFLLNPDATVAPDAIALCLARLAEAPDDVVAVAPKMLLDEGPVDPSTHRPSTQGTSAQGTSERRASTIDAVGIGVSGRGEAANRGLGQPDLGQYDGSDDVFGACFGAALIRRNAFAPDMVGPLDERLFLYYEDVAWCWSAQLLGYRVVTEPRAVVRHVMSAGVVRERPYDFKFEHTERNLLLCALMFFELDRAARVALRRTVGIVRGSVLGRHYPVAGLRALRGVLVLLPHVYRTRRRVTRRRRRSDAEIIAYRSDEPIFFDSVRYVVADPTAADQFARARLRERAQP